MSEKEYNNSICPLCKREGEFVFSTRDKLCGGLGTFFLFHCHNCLVDFIEAPENLADYYIDDYFYNLVEDKGMLFKIKSYIINNYYNQKNAFKKRFFGFFLGFISALPKSAGRIMDVGCGPGDILYLLRGVGFDVYGLDISQHAVDMAHKNGLKNVVVGMEDKLKDYSDNYFDYIRGSHVIEHVPDPICFVNLCYKKMAKDGTLILATPNIRSLTRFIFGIHAKCYRDIPRHIIIFSNKGIVKILKNAGFRNIKITYKTMFSDFYAGLFCFLDDKFHILDSDSWEKIRKNIFVSFIFLPIDLFFILLRKGETMTISAVK